MNRRTFLRKAGGLAVVVGSGRTMSTRSLAADRAPHIVLRSSWQTINIGDIAHTPGALALLERYLPEARVTLWAANVGDNVRLLLERRFPQVAIHERRVSHDAPGDGLDRALEGTPLADVLASADLVLHGSGPHIVSPDALYAARALGRPYGVYGVTLGDLHDPLKETAGDARFFYCRDTASLEYLKGLRLPCPVQEFAPDATFAIDLRDDARADRYLTRHGLVDKQFLCVVPRLRWTPYPRLLAAAAKGDREAKAKLAANDRHAESDHAKLRAAIVAWVRETGHKVLLCPEMTYEVPLLRPLLYDKLPEAVKKAVVVKEAYWLTDEAASTYARAAAVLSCEMHSPIIAVANGTPAIHVRQPTDTRKGQMWRDVGLGEWLFEIDETDGAAIAARTVALVGNAEATRARLEAAMAIVRARQQDSMAVVKRSCGV